MWLSFVIPLYNCEQYIAACLDSILAQELADEEYEVIVINDGSTDKGAFIVERYCREHAHFRLIHKKNGGVSSARNRGIEEARGTYIHFMDADDRLLPGGMRILKENYLQGTPCPDMIKFWAHTVDAFYSTEEWERIRPHSKFFQGSFLEFGNRYGFGWSVFTQIISRNLLIDHQIRFQPYVISEDVLFLISVFTVSEATVIATDLNIYRYCVRENSALTKVDRKHIERVLAGYIDIFKQVSGMKAYSPYDSWVFEKEIDQFRRGFFTRILSVYFPYKELREMLAQSREIGFYPSRNAATSVQRFINWATRYPWVLYGLSILYRYIFLPYIKNYIPRN